jgi:CRISPR-associated protein Cas1
MMSKPDFMKKQILFFESNKDRQIRFKNSNLILINNNNKIVLQHSCHRIFIVFVYGECSISSVMIKNAKKHSIPIIFLNYSLKPYFSLVSSNEGNFLLRKKQYLYRNNIQLAQQIVKNKIRNQIVLMKSLRYKTKSEKASISRMHKYLLALENIKEYKTCLGIEGNASKEFFTTYFKNINFNGRKPRCKTDITNLLLDIGYYYLFNFIDANLQLYGFDTYCGFYHRLFFQRKSLVCDIIEPFRCIIEKRIRKSYNLHQIDEKEFGFKNGQFFIKRDFSKKYSRIFLKEILLYKEEIFLYIQKYYRCFMKDRPISEYPNFRI